MLQTGATTPLRHLPNARKIGHRWGLDPSDRDQLAIDRVRRAVDPFFGPEGWFGLTVRGWENLPDRPVMLVSNHSGGTTIPDMWGLLVSWLRRFGSTRVVHPLAHDMIFALPAVGEFFAKLGVLRATPGMGRRVLSETDRDLFVCPGGDKDTWRPWKDRWKVNFAGRKGYAKLALQTGVPVVPVANAGAHESLVVLTDGARLARRLHLPELFRAEIFPVHLSLPWGLGVGPMPHLPLPVHLRYRIGAPVPLPADLPKGVEPSAAAVEAYDLAVRGALQRLLDELKAERVDRAAEAHRVARFVAALRRRARGPTPAEAK